MGGRFLSVPAVSTFSVATESLCEHAASDGEPARVQLGVHSGLGRFRRRRLLCLACGGEVGATVLDQLLATHPDGETSSLALPLPRTAFVPATHVQIHEPE